MSLSERRAAAIKLLAEIDQNEREAAMIASSPSSTEAERRRAIGYRNFFRESIIHAERLLAQMKTGK